MVTGFQKDCNIYQLTSMSLFRAAKLVRDGLAVKAKLQARCRTTFIKHTIDSIILYYK